MLVCHDVSKRCGKLTSIPRGILRTLHLVATPGKPTFSISYTIQKMPHSKTIEIFSKITTLIRERFSLTSARIYNCLIWNAVMLIVSSQVLTENKYHQPINNFYYFISDLRIWLQINNYVIIVRRYIFPLMLNNT